MSFTETHNIQLGLIDIPEWRTRDIRAEAAEILADNLAVQPLYQPIGLRPKEDRYELVYGGHRLAAFKLLNRATIPAFISDMDDSEALASDIFENVMRVALTPLEKGRAYRRLKTIYEEIYPDTKVGERGRIAANFSPESQLDIMDGEPKKRTPAYIDFAADKYDLSRASIARLIKLADRLSPELESMMKNHPVETNNSQLMALANLVEDNRKPVLKLILNDKAKTVAEAVDIHLNIKKPAPQLVRYGRAKTAFRQLKPKQKIMLLSEVLHDYAGQEFNGFKIVKANGDE